MQGIYWIIAIVLSAAAGYWVFLADKKREVPYPWLTALLRSFVIFLSLLLIFVPFITITKNETQKPIILFLQDNSISIPRALGKDTIIYRKNAEQLIEKLNDKYRVVRWGFGTTVQSDSIFKYKQQSTNISEALTKAQEFYGLQNLGAVILATDGRFNEGSNPQYQQLALHSPLYAVGIGDTAIQKDLRIADVFANKTASLNSQFEIRADIIATLCKGYSNNVQLIEAGNTLGLSTIAVNSDHYDRSVSFTIKADRPGLHHYVVSMPIAEGETNAVNNRKDVFVEVVDEKKNILIVAASPHPDINAIREALSGMESYKVTVKLANDIPTLNNYQVIVLHQLPNTNDNLFNELRLARKPIWYIVGSQSAPHLLQQLKKPAAFNINTMVMRDIQPLFNPSFNLFTLPQTMQAVIDKMPPLSVPTGQVQAMPDASVLFTQRNGTEQVPLWILQQGNTPMAMITGEGLWRWRLYEYRFFNQHTVIDDCIRQTVAFLSANSNNRPFHVQLPKYIWSDQEPISLNAYLLNANNEQVNTPEVQLTISDSSGKKQHFSLERSGNAYKLNIGIWAGGTYTYTATTVYNGKTNSASGSFVVQSMPIEMMETGADYPMLHGLAHKYNGGFVPASNITSLYDSISKNEQIKPVIQTNIETVPLVDRKWYFFLILLFAVAEWLLRKYWLAQ